jgi:CheY-like chemotaxis protein
MPTILLADDDPMQHELVQATLGRAHRVLQAWNGREALAVARRERRCPPEATDRTAAGASRPGQPST